MPPAPPHENGLVVTTPSAGTSRLRPMTTSWVLAGVMKCPVFEQPATNARPSNRAAVHFFMFSPDSGLSTTIAVPSTSPRARALFRSSHPDNRATLAPQEGGEGKR